MGDNMATVEAILGYLLNHDGMAQNKEDLDYMFSDSQEINASFSGERSQHLDSRIGAEHS
jgi:hypothetical protein